MRMVDTPDIICQTLIYSNQCIKTELTMKLTDVFAKTIKEIGIKHVFGLQGGAVVHFFDSLEKFKIGVTYNHHESCSALAAVSYAKVTQNIGCVVVTTGPGSTNAITGLMAAWQDSVPCLFISGQARAEHTSYGKKVRQVGTQEVNICDVVKPLAKYVKFIKNKKTFLTELEKAINISLSGRQGPVWLDVALDIQWADISFKKIKINKNFQEIKPKFHLYKKILKYLANSRKPLLVIGGGAKGKIKELLVKKIIKKYNLPIVTTWNSADILDSSHKHNLGIIGMSGQRGANKAIFESDLLICLGTRLAIPHTTTLYKNYAPKSKKIIIDIDANELKNANVEFDLKVHDKLENFLEWFSKRDLQFKTDWKDKFFFKNQNWYEPKKQSKPNSNLIIKTLTKNINKKTCIIVDGGGTALYSGFQSSHIHKNNRLVCSSAISSMGTGLAETIGAAKSNKFKKLICIIGDGSFLMNIQDLQTIVQDKINVIILLVNNNGYLAIRHTQKEFLNSRYYGTHPEFNLTLPNFQKISNAFGIKYIKINTNKNLKKTLSFLKKNNSPIVCEIITDENQPSLFKQGYKRNAKGLLEPQPLSEMFPYFENQVANTNN